VEDPDSIGIPNVSLRELAAIQQHGKRAHHFGLDLPLATILETESMADLMKEVSDEDGSVPSIGPRESKPRALSKFKISEVQTDLRQFLRSTHQRIWELRRLSKAMSDQGYNSSGTPTPGGLFLVLLHEAQNGRVRLKNRDGLILITQATPAI